jgi:hypothetical protein
MRRHGTVAVVVRRIAVIVPMLAALACGKHYLNQYEFADKTLGLVFIDPPSPDLLHGWYDIDIGQNAVQTVVRAGAQVAKEVEARKARVRFDSAAAGVDVDRALAQKTLERASRYLGTRSVVTPEGADYVLEVSMKGFGIDARSSNAAYVYARAEAVLLDRKTGREIWSEDINGRDRVTPFVIGTANVPSAIFTAATLHHVTVAQFQEALEQAITLTSTRITDELREKLRDVRDR